MKRRNAILVLLAALVLEAVPYCVYLPSEQAYFSCISSVPVSLGIVTPTTTFFLTALLTALSLIYYRKMSRGLSLAMLILDSIAMIAVIGTLLAGFAALSGVILLLLLVHSLLIWQTRRL